MTDESTIVDLHHEMLRALSAGDIDRVMALFTEDAVRVDEGGKERKGRDAIRDGLDRLRVDPEHGAEIHVARSTVRMVSEHVAVWEAPLEIIPKHSGRLMSGYLVDVLRKEGDAWRIIESHPTVYPTPPIR